MSMITLDFFFTDKYSINWHKVVHNKTDWQTIFAERLEKIKLSFVYKIHFKYKCTDRLKAKELEKIHTLTIKACATV